LRVKGPACGGRLTSPPQLIPLQVRMLCVGEGPRVSGPPMPETETRNPKPELRTPKPETRNPNPATRNPNPEARSPKPETRNPKPEIRSPKPEARTPKPKTRNPNPEPRTPKPKITNTKNEPDASTSVDSAAASNAVIQAKGSGFMGKRVEIWGYRGTSPIKKARAPLGPPYGPWLERCGWGRGKG